MPLFPRRRSATRAAQPRSAQFSNDGTDWLDQLTALFDGSLTDGTSLEALIDHRRRDIRAGAGRAMQ